MKRTRKMWVMGIVAAMAVLPSVMALTYLGPYDGEVQCLSQTYGGNGGGEFTLLPDPLSLVALSDYGSYTKNQLGIPNSFPTIFIEKQGSLWVSGLPFHLTLNNNALAGGVANPAGDPLSVGSAWLYKEFATGNLAGYGYNFGTAGRVTTAEQLQSTLWWLEGEVTTKPSNQFTTLVTTHFGGDAAAMADNNGFITGVKVLNLWSEVPEYYGEARQDVLCLVPCSVPDGGSTLALLGLAGLGLEILRRKLAK
jgi:hypothetical protein